MSIEGYLKGPQGHFVRALESFLTALWGALGSAEVPFPGGSGSPEEEAWLEHAVVHEMRGQIRERLVSSLLVGQVRRIALEAWRRAAPPQELRSTVDPKWIVRVLTRNRRIVRTPQELFSLLEAHFKTCERQPQRCGKMRTGNQTLQRAFSSWFRRSKAVAQALRQVERLGMSQGDLFIYLSTQRKLDCCLDLALTTEDLEVEAARLPLWARDASRWYRELRRRRSQTEMMVLDEDGRDRTGSDGDLVPRIGVELEDQLQFVASLCGEVLRSRHPADQFVVRVVWGLILASVLEADTDDQDHALSGILRTLAVESALPAALAEAEERLSDAERKRRWKRPVLRLALLGALDAQLYEQERRAMLERSDPLFRKIVESVEDVGPRTSTALLTGTLPGHLADPARLDALAAEEQRDRHFAIAVHLLRDIYDEALGALSQALSRKAESLDDFFLSSSAGRSQDRLRINPSALMFACRFSEAKLDEREAHPDLDRQADPATTVSDDTISEEPWKQCLTEEERELLSLLESDEQTEARWTS